MADPERIFFGYPSRPEMRRETLATAADKIGLSKQIVSVTWEDLQVGGHLIIGEILRAIDGSSAAVFDITSLNQNVLFELGYAIGSQRRVWLVRDGTDERSAQAWKRFGLLRSVGYQKYANSDQIIAAFERARPFRHQTTLFEDLIAPSLSFGFASSIFYVKSLHDTDPARSITRTIAEQTEGQFSVVVADPSESSFQPLSWHAQRVFNTRAVIVHFTGQGRRDADVHNARCALIAGLAAGMDRPVLMLAESDYSPPIDYEGLLRVYHNASTAGELTREWLAGVLPTAVAVAADSLPSRALALASELRSLRLGSHVAEDERETLGEYFVETRSFLEALGGATTVFVGRKGSGKTANLIRVSDELRADRRNLVCIIKPPAYELDGILRLLSEYKAKDSKGHLVESLWKFLLFTELARAAVEDSESRVPPDPASPMGRLVGMVRDRDGIAHAEFAVRLERAVTRLLEQPPPGGEVEAGRLAVAEALHDTVLRELRELLGKALAGRARIAILVDNLDKAWERDTDLDSLAFFLLGLLGTIRQIANEFGKKDRWREPVPVSLAVFLRSDIYAHVARIARERDKLPTRELLWEDPELLLRVLEDRFAASRGEGADGKAVWNYFAATVAGTPTRDWIIERIIPRPRDLVYLANAAITNAVNRGHALVQEKDLLDAEADYSHFALDSITVEGEVSVPDLEDVLYQFAGATSQLSEEEVLDAVSNVPASSGRERDLIRTLRDLNFLGIEVADGVFDYPRNAEEDRRAEVRARRLSEMHGTSFRYMIYPAFWPYLEIDSKRAA